MSDEILRHRVHLAKALEAARDRDAMDDALEAHREQCKRRGLMALLESRGHWNYHRLAVLRDREDQGEWTPLRAPVVVVPLPNETWGWAFAALVGAAGGLLLMVVL